MAQKLLLVDDSLFMRNMLRQILEEEGYEIVAEASDGAEAVEKFREFRPEIITMDIIMPIKNGIEALSEIIAEDPSVKIVMCSAVGQESLTRAAQEAGARDFILKPFNPGRVKEVIKSIAEA